MLYWYLVLNIWYQSSRSWGFAATSETPWNFRYNFFSTMFQKKRSWRIFSRWIKVRWVQNSSPEALYFQRYSLYKIGFWNHPEMSHCGIFAIKTFSVTFQTLKSRGYLHKLVRYLW
jgi:CMP-2-keto-3-deoxyoctulosonic acid synthetase